MSTAPQVYKLCLFSTQNSWSPHKLNMTLFILSYIGNQSKWQLYNF